MLHLTRKNLVATLSLAAALAAASGLPDTAPAQTANPATITKANCAPTAIKTQTLNTFVSTTSQTFIPVPSGKVNFTHAGGCILVTFSAEALAVNDALRVQVVLTGDVIDLPVTAVPKNNTFSANDTGALGGNRSMTYVFSSAPAGKLSINMQYRSTAGNTVQLGNRTIAVQYVAQ